MTARIDEKRLADLRTAAEVAIRMSSLQPHTVHLRPDELVSLLEEVYIARAQERPHPGIACRKCGCTDTDCAGCIERTGAPCSWVERDLCSACSDTPQLLPAESLASSLCVRHGLPAVMVIALDGAGALHLGCAAVNDPITTRFVELARSLNLAIERGVPGFAGITREQAIEIARRCAKAKPQSYYAEPFDPHEWVLDAILRATSTLPSVRANCGHCGLEGLDDVDAIRAHSMSCDKSPVVRELKRLRAIADQAEVVARHWETQDGINGAELDKLRDIFFEREVHGG